MAVWSPESVKDFIQLYKSNPCLWKMKSPDYNNKRMRAAAYEQLTDYCKEIGFKSANQDFVRKKIGHLRGAFAKELRKVVVSMQTSTNPDEVHKPSLWYFDLLLFTKEDQEIGKDDEKDNNDSDGDTSASSGKKATSKMYSIPHSVHLPSYTAPPPSKKAPPVKKIKKDRSSERSASDDSDGEGSFNGAPSWPQTDLKRKDPFPASMTEYEAVGVAIARKLQRMDRTQCIYAEAIINSVMRKGLMSQLTEVTDLCDNNCGRSYGIDEFK